MISKNSNAPHQNATITLPTSQSTTIIGILEIILEWNLSRL